MKAGPSNPQQGYAPGFRSGPNVQKVNLGNLARRAPTEERIVLPDETPQGWKRPFDDAIVLPDGRALLTLEDAGDYITMLPKADQQLDEWQTAIECLMLVVKLGGPTMFARIGIMRALNGHVERVFDPSRKEKHWGGAN
jgi:hypothetical protein